MKFQSIDHNNLPSNCIAKFSDYQHLLRESNNFLDFLLRYIHQGREALKVILLVKSDQALPATLKLAQTCHVCLWLVWGVWPDQKYLGKKHQLILNEAKVFSLFDAHSFQLKTICFQPIRCTMISFNAQFFDHKCLQKESANILDLFTGHSYQ